MGFDLQSHHCSALLPLSLLAVLLKRPKSAHIKMSPPTVDKFLEEIAGIIKEKNGTRLQEYLIYEPPLPPLYNKIVSEIKQFYPPNSQKALENKCISFIPEYDEDDDGGSRTTFVIFMVKYFAFLRDVNVDNLIETHDLLKALLKYVAPSPLLLAQC